MNYALIFVTILNVSIFGLKYTKNFLCQNCKWFMPNMKYETCETKNNCGFCKMFPNKILTDKEEIILYDYAEHSRKNENLCGPEAYLFDDKYIEYFKQIEEGLEVQKKEEHINDLLDEYDELESRFSVEVMEKDEIKEIEDRIKFLIQEITNYYFKE